MADQGSYYVPEQSKLPLGAALGMRRDVGDRWTICDCLLCWFSHTCNCDVQVVGHRNRGKYEWDG